MTRTATIWILVATAVVLIGWDVYAYLGTGTGATISRVVLDWVGQHPVLAFAAGVLSGHLFWPQFVRAK